MLAYLSLAGALWRRAERVDMSSDDADWWRSGLVDGACLINASTAAVLTTLPAASTGVFGQSVFVQGTFVRCHRNERPLRLRP